MNSVVPTLAVGLLAAVLFLALPQLDIAASAMLADGAAGFPLAGALPVRIIREAFNLVFAGFCVVAAGGLAVTFLLRRRLFGLGANAWLYLIACAATGPGLVTNLLFKDHWGRARPAQIAEFGGDLDFTPALLLSDQCERNCSFVSGEASSIYLMFFALAMLFPSRQRRLVLAGILAGSIAGLIRMMAGGHFLSDVVFAGIFMALVAQLLAVPLLGRERASGAVGT